MTLGRVLLRIAAQEDVNFLLTNRIPRRLATRFMGWFSRIEQPLVRDLSIATWKLFCDVDLADARTTRFRSLHEAFIRDLREGARPACPDPDVLASPCDAILGACGPIEGTRVFQIKGSPYDVATLLGDVRLADECRDGTFATLRLTAGMYHRFHAPQDARVDDVASIPGDTWNVNPIALKRIEALFCRNERAVIRLALEPGGQRVILVAVAAILVAGLRFRFLAGDPDPRSLGPGRHACGARLRRGDEMGWFQHGSTIVVLAPPGFRLAEGLAEGSRLKAGEALMRFPRP